MLSSVQSAFADDAKWTNKYIKTVNAAVTSTDNLTTGYYMMRNVGHKSWLYGNGNSLTLDVPVRSDELTAFNTTFAGSTTYLNHVVYVTKNSDNNTYTIQTISGNYFPASLPHGSGATANATAGNYTIENISGDQFSIKAETTTTYKENGTDVTNILYADGNGSGAYSAGTFTGWSTTQPEANTYGAYQFYPVTIENTISANFKYTVNGHIVLAASKQVIPNATFTADNYPCLTITGYDKETISESGDVVVNCTMTLPIEGSTVDAPKYYAVKMHTGDAMWTANADGTISCVSTSTSSPELPSAAKQWAFIGDDLFTNFKIYNKETGKYLVSTGSDAATLGEESEATSFHVMASRVQSMTNGFCISRTDTRTETYLNYQDNAIKTWYDNDEGSTCTAFTPVSFPLNYAAAFQAAPEGAIGGPKYLENTDNLNAFKAAYNAAKADATDENVAALVTYNNNIASSEAGVQMTEGYYRLVNRKDHNNLHINGTIMNDQAGKGKAVGSVFYFKDNGDGKYSISVEGKYLGIVNQSQAINLGDESSKGTFAVTTENFVGKIQETSNTTGSADYHYIHVNGGNAVGWTAAESSPASHWYIVPATDVEIAMNAAGSNTYATAYLPFPVSAVSGAKAYVGALSADKTTLNMTNVESIPANTGVVLEGTGNTATLTIGEATATVTDNALTGSNTDVTIASGAQSSYLVLGASESTIGFYTPASTVTKLAANKAYINASSVAASALKLNFGCNATGINTIAVDANNGFNAPVFDLSGRRVVAPVKGGVYIQNGKKFIK